MDAMGLMTVGLDVAIVHLKQFVPGYKSKYVPTLHSFNDVTEGITQESSMGGS